MKYSDVKNHLGHKFKSTKEYCHFIYQGKKSKLGPRLCSINRCTECDSYLSDIMEDHIFQTCDEIRVRQVMKS
jgi:hypothetical protein